MMPIDDKDDKKQKLLNPIDLETDEGESGESGESGQGSGIQFVDFTSPVENLRDDLLSYEDIKRLISSHKDTNELRVKSQKEKRDEYRKLREDKITLQAFRERERAAGRDAFYKTNPMLADKAQFSGIDKQVNALPTENLADTNKEQRDRLENKLRLGYSAQPRFNPKPQGPGYS